MASKRKKSGDNASASASESDDEDRQLTENEYIVDCILYEEVRDGETKYLIKWKDYPLEESTWEPTSSFTAGVDAILTRWTEDKKRIAEGFKDPLDLDEFNRKVFIYLNPGVAVPVSKKQKTSPSSGKSASGTAQCKITSKIFVGDSDSGDDMPLRQQKIENSPKMKSLGGQLTLPKSKAASEPDSDQRPLKRKEITSAAERTSSKISNGKSILYEIESSKDVLRKRKASPSDAPRSPIKKTKSLPVASAASTKPALGPSSNPTTTGKAPTTMKDAVSLAKEKAARVAEVLAKTQIPKSATSPAVPAQRIFGKKDPVRRTRKLTETGKRYSPSHIQNIIRQNQDGAAPDPSTLVLQNPADLISRPLRHQDSFLSASTTPLPPGITHRPAPKALEIPKEVAPYAQSIPLICAYVHEGRICPEGAHECRFLHEKDPEKQVAAHALHQQARDYKKDPERRPKFNSPVIVCTFQFKNLNGCFREENCAFAHWKPLKGGWEFHLHKTAERKTCPYWAKGRCRFNAEQCEFAHEMLPEMADFAEKPYLTCPFWYANQYEGMAPCTRGSNCTFAHELTPTIAYNPRTKSGPRHTDPALLQAAMNQRMNGAAPEPLHIAGPTPPPPPVVPQMGLPMPPADQEDIPTPTTDTPTLEMFDTPFTEAEADTSILDQIDTSTMFGMTLDLDDVEFKIYMEIYPELLAYINEYWPEERRVVEPNIVPFDDVTGIIFEVYSEKLETGRLHPMDYEFDLAELADHLAHEDSCLIVQFSDMILILYPSRGDVDDEDAPPPDSALGFEIRTVKEEDRESLLDALDEFDEEEAWIIDISKEEEQDIEDKQDDQLDDEAASLFFKETFDMEFEDLFKWPTGSQTIKKDIFVLVDEDREIEMLALRRLLRWCGAGTAQPDDEGSWEEFKHNNEGVVIIDERYTEYHNLPYFSHLLLCRYNFFELQVRGESVRLHQLFRSGQTIFLTDQVLEDEPALALSVVEHVKERNKNKLPGTESRRIFARPGVMEWLGDLAGSSSQEEDPMYESRAALWSDVASLLPIDSPTENISFTDRVVYEPAWITCHSNQYMDDPDAATEALLQAFHVTFLEHRHASRNWIVLHQKSEATKKQAGKWSETYHNLRFMTVEDFQTKLMGR